MIYDGSVRDTTNFCSHEYLAINSCNIQQNRGKPYTVIRDAGRVDYHILYIAEGECSCLYNGEERVMKKGNFVLYPPSVRQRYSFAEGKSVTTLWVHFSGYGAKELLNRLGLSGGIYRTFSEEEAERCFARMIYSHSVKTNRAQVAAIGELVTLFSLLSHEDDGQPETVCSETVQTMLRYIHVHWQRPITVADVAGKVCLSESRTSHLFKAVMGKGIHQYVMGLRIDSAKELLQSTDLSISEVGEMVGFQDALYFSRAFRKEVHRSPAEFRKTGSKEPM